MPLHPRVIMVFLDGVGIGKKNPLVNPFFAAEYPAFMRMFDGGMISSRNARRSSASMTLKPIDATLGVKGLPQSGTGQTALMTGVNASRMIGKHFGPYPFSTLRPVIAGKNIFSRLREKGKTGFYANAFPQRYFDFIESRQSRVPTLAYSWISSGASLNDSAALASGRALAADITNEKWNANGFPAVPVLSPEEAGKRLVEFGGSNDFVLFEYSFTDHAGHSQSMAQAVGILRLLDRFLGEVVGTLDHSVSTLIVTSDHGNIEDLSTKSHTRNAVPFLTAGRHHAAVAHRVNNLTHVAAAIEYLLT